MGEENRLTAVVWVRRVKGLSKGKKRKTHGHRQQYGD